VPPHTYPLEPWCLRETRFDPASHFLAETLFALGNGYIGLRGTGEEGYTGPAGTSLDGTYLNGFYESEAIRYPEAAYGLARNNQFMLNVPNAKGIALWLEDEAFDLLTGTLLQYERLLDFRTGVLSRTMEWTSPQGRKLRWQSRRVVSFENKHLYAIEVVLTPLNFSGNLRLVTTLDGAVSNQQAGDDPRVGSAVSGQSLQTVGYEQNVGYAALVQRTHNSGFTLVSATESMLEGAEATLEIGRSEQALSQIYAFSAAAGQSVTLTKYACYFSSRDYAEDELSRRAADTLAQARAAGFTALQLGQQQYLAAFWQQADVQIAGDDALQQGMHFNQFHLLQSVGRDGKTNIAAKGVTGEGYEGHYFWDTEIYIFPFFLYSKPEIARKLLEYRHAGLAQARERARQMAHAKGALYPWRTIAGEECSAYFPAGTAQYHINADIAYSIKQYMEATDDRDYLVQYGAEIVLETARIWMGLGHYDRHGAYCINQVTGPDEYTALVNNNYYTNAMAQMHLHFAADIVAQLQQQDAAALARIANAIDLGADEAAQWRAAATQMKLPYDTALQIHAQDDSFLDKKVWDFANTPAENYPLLLNYHPLVIYRHQVCKQADVVLALLLLSGQFSLEDKRRDFDYYEAVTTHDSSLSSCIFSIIAAEVGYAGKAYDYFMETARLDLDNTHGNTHYGVHTAAMAGTWLGVAYGFGGMRVEQGMLRFTPTLPQQWQHYSFNVQFRGAQLAVSISAGRVEYLLLRGDALTIRHGGETLVLNRQHAMISRSLA